ncbi:MAG: tRNA pseudouridine(13) synthase TruD [Gammaproteobacteria bacterium]|nr:tRNA pseudouridine(13) synthase TruD [Gammaproteobacteria bacterium]HAN81443.1 tRNA pseudouridine(13) synthase TruD [Gammaproteobacteria bacterium]
MNNLSYGNRSIELSDLPRGHGEPVFEGKYRVKASDFLVTEDLGFEPEGIGPHIWALIRKVGISTEEACLRLGRATKVSRRDLGYAGKKDTHAISIQWVSLPDSARIDVGSIDSCLKVLRLSRNQRKLKIGQLAGNYFQVRLYGVVMGNLSERLKAIGSVGVPNYFGLQRFGRSGSNLERARQLARRDPSGSRRLHPRDGMAASAARSAGFNTVVAERLRTDRWLDVTVGDVVSLAGRGSHFPVSEADISNIQSRIMAGELDTTAPMAGRISKTSSEQNAFETATLQTDPELFDWMTGIFREEDRRAVRVLPKHLEAEVSENTLQVSFWLPKGSFATAVLNELGTLRESYARTAS